MKTRLPPVTQLDAQNGSGAADLSSTTPSAFTGSFSFADVFFRSLPAALATFRDDSSAYVSLVVYLNRIYRQGMFVSVPWYETEEDFMTILQLAPFEEAQHFSRYEQWIIHLEGIEKAARDKGLVPYRVTVKPDAVKSWAKANDLPINSANIARYTFDEMIKAQPHKRKA